MNPTDQRPICYVDDKLSGQGLSAQVKNTTKSLTAPFPVVRRETALGGSHPDSLWHVDVYAEPFAGSLAVLLASAPHKRDVVCDTDGGICNFWRALAADPDAVAHWADWPTIHDDLTARHRYLVRWVIEHADELRNDPEYYDAKVAGWWVWGISIWIGGGWCQPNYRKQSRPGPNPEVCSDHGRSSAELTPARRVPDRWTDVSAQRVWARGTRRISDSADRRGAIPKIDSDHRSRPDKGARLRPWLHELAARLKGVIVLNRSWESAVTPSVLAQTDSGSHPPVGILLDPPYTTEGRDAAVYGSPMLTARVMRWPRQAWTWAQAHGDRYRIAYCCHEGDVAVPDVWTSETQSFSGIRTATRREDRRDQILFSPACLPDDQRRLF